MKPFIMVFWIAIFTWVVGPTTVDAHCTSVTSCTTAFYGPYVKIEDLGDHVWGSWCSWSKFQTASGGVQGWGTFSDGECTGVTKRWRTQTNSTGFYVLVADAKDAEAYYMDIMENSFKTADDLSQSAIAEAHENNMLYRHADALAEQGVVGAVNIVEVEASKAGMAEIYEWDNSGSHGTIRSVMYTDDEIESINHMIAIEMFPWPHAVGLTESFNLGVKIGQCEAEWSYHHSSGMEPWGSIPGNKIREYCSEKATGIDVSELYP